MKNKILTFIIGALVGAIIATLGFYMYSKNNTNEFKGGQGGSGMSQNGERPGMPSGMSGDFDGQTPPEKPDGDNSGALNKKSDNTTKSKSENTTEDTSNNI